ncbi:MAG: C1 family peptidase [Candidatus Eremiobacteraeota bacterium]|nr:C1 family peptidase [Candidatus Eremiobacteraeota bacterium]NNM93460.1 C1 family peptidase [Candidatus Eremiobacteraeota bacterium]
MFVKRALLSTIAAIGALLLSACGASNATFLPSQPSAPLAVATPATVPGFISGLTTPLTFNIAIPSPGVGAVTGVSVSGNIIGQPAQTVTAPCTPTGCSVSVPNAPVGPSGYVINLTAGSSVLSTATIGQYVLYHAQSVGLSFGGTIASVKLSVEPTTVKIGTPQNVLLTLLAYDANGNRIVGSQTLTTPVLVTAPSSAPGTLPVIQFTSANQRLTFAYNGGSSGYGATTFTGTVGSLTGTATLAEHIPNDTVNVNGTTETVGGDQRMTNEMAAAFGDGSTTFSGAARRPLALRLPQSATISVRPPSGNQGAQGSCVAWATGYMTASTISGLGSRNGYTSFLTGAGAPDYTKILSPAFIYNQIRLPNGGSLESDALTLLIAKGDPPWVDMPYNPADDLTKPSSMAFTAAQPNRITNFTYLPRNDPNGIAQIKASIAAGVPVPWGANVDAGFNNLTATSIWTGPTATGGGHAMAIVGYDDANQAFIVANSWGTDWANNGTFYLAYSSWNIPTSDTFIVNP